MKRNLCLSLLTAALVAMPSVFAPAALIVWHPLDDAIVPAAYANQGSLGPVHDVNTAGSGAIVGAGKLGNAVSLPGSGGALSQTSTSDSPVLSDALRTVSLWINAPVTVGGTNPRTPLAFGRNMNNGSNPGQKFDVDVDENGFLEIGVGGGRTNGTGQTAMSPNTWYLLTVALPATAATGANGLRLVQELDFYVNAQPAANVSTVAGKEVGTVAGTFAIGRGANNATSQLFNGLIDDVAIWDEDLSPAEILGLYDVGNVTGYNAGQFDQLKGVHDAQTGAITIGGLTWRYFTGLGGTSLTAGGAEGDVLVLDPSDGSGLVAIPEPTSASLLAVFAATLLCFRRK
jgi:hypothetical protein